MNLEQKKRWDSRFTIRQIDGRDYPRWALIETPALAEIREIRSWSRRRRTRMRSYLELELEFSHPLLFVKLPGHEKENAEFQLEFSRRHLKRYYVSPGRERTLDCENCSIISHSAAIDPYSSTIDCPKPLEKAVFNAFVELKVIDATTDVRDNATRDLISSVVRKAEMLATNALDKGCKKMGMEVEIVLESNYAYDEEAAMQLQEAMLASAEEASISFVPASKNAVDNLEKMMLEPNVFGSCDGSSCRICLEDMEIGSEVTRMPCSHVFHPGCIDSWLDYTLLFNVDGTSEEESSRLESMLLEFWEDEEY
ncbi:hypothetical protein Syun_011388 [Stephania yunnanensis]|uniref:RING-type domain-containing protein n=1 Tax=Stephania yunnanensis TaxID=152371 RepID=A0AAP0JXF6_9MAGN